MQGAEAVGRVINGVADLHKARDGHGVLGDQRHITGGGIVVGVKETVRIGKMRAGAAQLGGLGVHLFRKGSNTAADMLCQCQRGVVAGRKHQTVQQISDRDLLADMLRQSHQRAVRIQSLQRVLRDGDKRFVPVADVFRRDDKRHDLGGGSGILPLVGVLLIYDRAVVEILQIYRIRHGAYVAAVIDRSGGEHADAKDHDRNNKCCYAFHSFLLFVFFYCTIREAKKQKIIE